MSCLFSKGISFRRVNFGSFRSIFLNNKSPLAVLSGSHPNSLFHSSVCYHSDEPENVSVTEVQKPVRLSSIQAKKLAEDTVDWLPFPWKRPAPYNLFEDSGDLVKVLEYDPAWPKPDFEFSDELKTASPDIKYKFSLATASKGEIKEVIKRRWLQKIQRHPNDFDSLEVNIALRTLQVRTLFEHSVLRKKERRGGRRILYIVIGKRNKYLKVLYRTDRDRFNWLIQELKLYYKPLILSSEKYTKQWDLRRLTKEYCAKMLKEKKMAYHEEFKKQQTNFLKEKEEILAWIEKEQKEISDITEELEKITV